MTNKHFLVIENSNYADEFDLQGYRLFKANSEEELKELLLEDRDFPEEFYFGTNECIEIDSEEEFFDCLDIQEISKEQYKVLEKLLGDSFGITSLI